MRFLQRGVALLLATLMSAMTAVVLAATPASAGIPGLARGNVVLSDLLNSSHVAIGVRACGSGNVDDGPFLGGSFVYELVGAASDVRVINDIHSTYPGPSFVQCTDVLFQNATYGGFTVVVTYSGIGLDVTTLAYGVVAWSPETNGSTWLSSGT